MCAQSINSSSTMSAGFASRSEDKQDDCRRGSRACHAEPAAYPYPHIVTRAGNCDSTLCQPARRLGVSVLFHRPGKMVSSPKKSAGLRSVLAGNDSGTNVDEATIARSQVLLCAVLHRLHSHDARPCRQAFAPYSLKRNELIHALKKFAHEHFQ